MITTITKDQALLGQVAVGTWIARARSTEPANREQFAKAMAAAYANVKLPPPSVKWFSSPLKALSTCVFEVTKKQNTIIVRKLCSDPIEQASRETSNRISVHVSSTLGKLLSEKVYNDTLSTIQCVRSELSIRGSVIADSYPKLGATLTKLSSESCYDARLGALAVYDYAYKVLGIRECWHLQGLVSAADSAGWYWPFEDMVIACERPSKMTLDKDGKLHSDTGRAIEWADGFGAHAYHGQWVPREAVAGGIRWEDVERTADPKLRDTLVAMRAEKWSKEKPVDKAETSDERMEAAMAIKRLGGIAAVGELIGEKTTK